MTGRHRVAEGERYPYPLPEKRPQNYSLTDAKQMWVTAITADLHGQRTTFRAGVSHRGIFDWDKTRKLRRWYIDLFGCPVCKEEIKWRSITIPNRRTHHCYVINYSGETEVIDVCYDHFKTLSALYFYLVKQRYAR